LRNPLELLQELPSWLGGLLRMQPQQREALLRRGERLRVSFYSSISNWPETRFAPEAVSTSSFSPIRTFNTTHFMTVTSGLGACVAK
jgi:hypothetical protein